MWSLWVKFVRVFKRITQDEDVRDRAKMAEDTIFGAGNVKIDVDLVDATAKLTEAFCKNKTPAVIDLSIYIFTKLPDKDGNLCVYAKRLTVRERSFLNENPKLAADPFRIAEQMKLEKLDPHAVPVAFREHAEEMRIE